MDKRCTVCNHSQTHDINLALLAGAALDTLKQQFGLSRSALHRHKRHLEKNLDMAEDKMRHNVMMSYLFQLNDYNGAAAATVAAARAEGNPRLTLQAANAGARIITAMAKFEVDLDRETIYRFMTSPEYVQSGCLLPGDPQILAGPRQTLVASLTAACPEPAPGDLFDPEDVAEYLKLAQEPSANTSLPRSRQLEFPGFLTPLADVLPAAALEIQRDRQVEQEAGQPSFLASNRKPKTENRKPSFKRDRSGTEAGQTAPCAQESSENQTVKQDAEKSETTPATPRRTANGKRQTAKKPLRRQVAQLPAPAAPDSCNSDQLYEQYLREKAAALAALAPSPASHGAQAPPPVPLGSREEIAAFPKVACHISADASATTLETGSQEPETDAAPPQTTEPCLSKPKDCFAGYFKFPGDYPPGYLFAVTHGYWPDDHPEHIPDRRWEEDFLPAGRFGKTKGTY